MSRPSPAPAVLLAAALALALAPSAARADGEEPHCGDGKRQAPPRICAQFEAAPKLAPDAPLAARAIAVWRRVAPPVAALTGRDTALALLAPEARLDSGQPFPPSAYICPGAPPTVYVPHTLLDRVYGPSAAYPEDFLAFVLGHELGHRHNDLTPDGCQLGAFERPGQGVREESLADFRGAFFAALGGFSTRTLARDATVRDFLAAEFKVRAPVLDERAAALHDALRDFDAYEGLYDAAIGLTFAGEQHAAQRLLAWADELVEARGFPLPELKVARALALLMGAAADAPWQEALEPTALPTSELRCRALLPAHTALWEEPSAGRVRGPGPERDRARRDLLAARRLLERSAELGAHRLLTDSALACVAFALGEPAEAQRLQRRVERRLDKHTPAAVREAARANAALIAFGAAVAAAPAPAREDAARAAAWAQDLARQARAFAGHPELAALLDTLATYPATPRPKRRRATPVACAGAPRPDPLPALPALTGDVGACPPGWTLAFSVPAPAVAAATGAAMGVTACRDPQGRRALHVRLPAALDPPLPAVDATLGRLDALPAPHRALDAWACACDALQPQGATDLGERTYLAACPALGVPLGVLFATPDGRVTRAMSVTTP